MDLDNITGKLLDQACPSIRYRLRREILDWSPTSTEMRSLQEQILEDKLVKEVLSWQQPDGWLAWDFHGSKSLEAGIRILCEKGIENCHPVMARALQALETGTDRLDRGIGKVGKILDGMRLGGSQMIRAVVFAYAGIEDKAVVSEQIPRALDVFRAVLDYHSLDDFSYQYKGKRVMKPGYVWPGIYHLRLLARTHGWRTPTAISEIGQCIQSVLDLSPLPEIYARHRSQLIAPASLSQGNFGLFMPNLNGGQWMMWFQYMELLARLGVVQLIPQLENQVASLMELLEASEGRFPFVPNHPYIRQWGAYTGLMLEPDWKTPARRANDLTFRALIINHYSCPRK